MKKYVGKFVKFALKKLTLKAMRGPVRVKSEGPATDLNYKLLKFRKCETLQGLLPAGPGAVKNPPDRGCRGFR